MPRDLLSMSMSGNLVCQLVLLIYIIYLDEHYGWVDMGPDHVLHGQNIFKNQTWTGYTLNMTSQQWLTDADFSPDSDTKSIRWHYLVVIVPDNVNWKRNGTLCRRSPQGLQV